MKIKLSSIIVNHQDRALHFYTRILGFTKKAEVPAGDFKWVTVVSPEGPDDIELVLEPNENAAARMYQEALFKEGIPITAFAVENLQKEYERLIRMGVSFHMEPTPAGETVVAIFEDTCGNLIQIYQE